METSVEGKKSVRAGSVCSSSVMVQVKVDELVTHAGLGARKHHTMMQTPNRSISINTEPFTPPKRRRIVHTDFQTPQPACKLDDNSWQQMLLRALRCLDGNPGAKCSECILSNIFELLSSRTTRCGGGMSKRDLNRQHVLTTLIGHIPTGTLSRPNKKGSMQCLHVQGEHLHWSLTERVGDGKYGETFMAHSSGRSSL